MVTTTDLVSYYEMEGSGATATDIHGSNDGTVTGASSTTGKIGNARLFDAATEKIVVSHTADLSAASHDISVSMWVNPTVSTGWQYYIIKEGDFAISSDNVGGWRFQDWSKIVTGGTITTGSWTHLVLVIDKGANVVRGYVNGNLLGTSATGLGSSGTNDITIGWRSSFEFNGSIDEVAIFKRVLTQQDVTDLYNSGAGLAYPFSEVTATLRLIKIAGTFVEKPILTKVAGTFVDKPIKIKVGGTFQDA